MMLIMQIEGEDRVDDAVHRLRQEKQDMNEELTEMKVSHSHCYWIGRSTSSSRHHLYQASLSDKRSMIEALKQQQAREQSQKRELQATIEK